MKPKRSNAPIILLTIALVVIGIAVYFGVTHFTKITFDDKQPFVQNITIVDKHMQGGLIILKDSNNVNYTTSERISITVIPNNNYTATIRHTDNGTGNWIDAMVLIPKEKPTK